MKSSGKKSKKMLISFVLLIFFSFLIYLTGPVLLENGVNLISIKSAFAEEEDVEKKEETPEEKKQKAEDAANAEKEGKKEASKAAKIAFDGMELKRIQNKKQMEKLIKEQEKLANIKAEIEEKIEKLEELHKQIKISLVKLNKNESDKELLQRQKETRKMTQLVKVYTSMKPKQAGQIINKLDIIVAEKLFMNMKGDIAGKILSYVESERAAQISERLVENGMFGSN